MCMNGFMRMHVLSVHVCVCVFPASKWMSYSAARPFLLLSESTTALRNLNRRAHTRADKLLAHYKK